MSEINYYEQLNKLREEYPALTFNNEGYENIPQEVREVNKEGNEKIETILKNTVAGFVKFQNFKPRSDGSYAVRCQTKWSDFFTGVTYIPLENFRPDHPSWGNAEYLNEE